MSVLTRWRLLPVLLVLGTLTAASAAWGSTVGTLIIEDVDTSAYPDVRLEIVVPGDLRGEAADAAFSLSEGGDTRSSTVSSLRSEALEVVLLIDTSGSMQRGPIDAARRAADSFIDRLPLQTEIAVVGFGSVATVLAPFATDRAPAKAAVTGLLATGETALYDGVATALAQFGDGDGQARRSVVLLSDGGDTASRSSLEDAVAALGDADVRLHVIELQTPESDPGALADLAAASDGQVVPVDDASGLDDVYAGIASEFANRFELRYRSEAHGSTTVRVDFSVDGVQASGERQIALPDAVEQTIAPPPIATRDGQLVTVPELWRNPLVVVGAGSAVFLGLLILTYVLVAAREPRRRLARETGREVHRRTGMTGIADRATTGADRYLQRRGRRDGLNTALEQAGVDLRAGEYIVLTASAATVAFGCGLLLANAVMGAVFAIMAVVSARVLLKVLISRRQAAFADQLGDVLQLLAGSLRAGYGLMQAVDAVAREADQPASDEFGRLVIESRLGRDTAQSLRAMADRVDSEDFAWVVQAIEIHREVGGDLAEVLDTTAETIRQRNQIRRQVKALSAEGRYSSYVLLALPPGVALMISLANPGYFSDLTGSGAGRVMLILAVLLMGTGAVWMRKLTRLVF